MSMYVLAKCNKVYQQRTSEEKLKPNMKRTPKTKQKKSPNKFSVYGFIINHQYFMRNKEFYLFHL